MPSYASVALIDHRGWVLMQERDEHPVIDPECWGLPGGAVEPGETPEAAAYRELEEETGVALADGLALVSVLEVDHAVVGPHTCHLYAAATALGDADVVCGEGRQMTFVDPAQVLGLPLTTSARQAWPELLASATYAEALR